MNVDVRISFEVCDVNGGCLDLIARLNEDNGNIFIDIYHGDKFWFTIGFDDLKKLVEVVKIMQKALEELSPFLGEVK